MLAKQATLSANAMIHLSLSLLANGLRNLCCVLSCTSSTQENSLVSFLLQLYYLNLF